MQEPTKCAIITGIAGQDGSYLAELLLEKGYFVFGFVRRTASDTCRERISHLERDARVCLVYGDLTDISSIANTIHAAINHPAFIDGDQDQPLEFYNLAAQSHVKVSFETPIYTAQADGMGVLNILETIRQLPLAVRNRVRFYQASTSEMFGASPAPQNDQTPFYPRSPYGVAKLYAHWITINYRESYGLWACSGILFNHESERRCKNFVTRKVTCSAAKYWASNINIKTNTYINIKTTIKTNTKYVPLQLGNLNAKRDWGYAPDYVQGIWLILQQSEPREYIISTGTSHTVRELVEYAFGAIGVTIAWEGNEGEEKGYNAANNELLVEVHPKYYRPAEVEDLCGDSTPIRDTIGWKPSITFEDMVHRMVANDKKEYA